MIKEKIATRVQTFLEKNENSCIAPGVKTTITRNGTKKRKRYFCDSMDNLYLKFQEETFLVRHFKGRNLSGMGREK